MNATQPCPFPAEETAITLQGPAGNLEAIIAGPIKFDRKIVGIVCHPHSLYGGAMSNKVVTTIVRALRELGLNTIRFNFRGVGKSAGEYDKGIGETEDLLTVMRWAKKNCANHAIWLAGFSFGSYVAARAASQSNVAQLISIAPPVNHFDFTNLNIRCPWLVVQGDQDEIVPAEEVLAWIKSLTNPPQLIYMKNTSHFFHGKLGELRQELEQALA